MCDREKLYSFQDQLWRRARNDHLGLVFSCRLDFNQDKKTVGSCDGRETLEYNRAPEISSLALYIIKMGSRRRSSVFFLANSYTLWPWRKRTYPSFQFNRSVREIQFAVFLS